MLCRLLLFLDIPEATPSFLPWLLLLVPLPLSPRTLLSDTWQEICH